MAAQVFKNNFDWAFIGPVTASTHVGYETTIGKGILQISDAASAVLGALSNGDWYILTGYKRSGSIESAIEIVKVLGVNEVAYAAAGECRIRVERGSEGTTPQTYVAGDLISMRLTAGGLNALASDYELSLHTGNTGNPHSTTASQVGAPSGSGTSTGDNTGDETTATIKTKLGITTLSGSNTGDQTITLTGGVTGSGTGSFAATVVTNANLIGPVTSTGNTTAIANGAITNAMLANAAVANLSGTNTGDETTATIKSKMSITTLSG